jgi:type VI secretion system protein ImpA
MPLRDELLQPIPGDNPSGAEMRYDPVYDKIKEARREDEDIPQGEWTTTLKTADWPQVIKLTKDTLAKKTKDLQLGAWLTEALLKREGFAGLRDGLDLLAGMIEQYWDTVYPELDEGDAEMRAAPLEWIGVRFDALVRTVPIDRQGHTTNQVKEARAVPTEAQAAESTEVAERRATMIADGKTTPEALEAGFTATPKAWYRAFIADVEGAIEALNALNDIANDKFGDVAPNFGKVLESLEEVRRSANAQLKRKLEIDPDPIEVDVAAGADAPAGGAAESTSAGAGGAPRSLAAEPTSPDDAASRIVGAAKFLRQANPGSPAPYLLLRGFRWGELRATTSLDPKLLEAPPTSVRTNLKGLLLDSRFPELLEACEVVMGMPYGRGWIDLQRYAITAAESIGPDYDAVATALKGALRSLLVDLPDLLEMTLMDDTPTANGETRNWLRTVIRANEPATESGGETLPPIEDDEPRGRDPISVARAEARAGRADRAIQLLMREASREKTRRGRFLLQSALARIMVDAGHHPVAMPILEELIQDIEVYKLEEWEMGELVAAPMSLLYKCLQAVDGDSSTRQSLYLRICRLDPIQAIGFSQS